MHRFVVAALSLVVSLSLGPVTVATAQPSSSPSDPLATAAELVRRHDDEAALGALNRLPLSTRRRAPARYLRGRVLERLGRLAEAADAYPSGDDAASLPPPVRADSDRRRAVALSRSGRCQDARALFRAQRADPLIEARLAECALALSDLPAAVEELRAVATRAAGPVDLFAARLSLAEALTRTGATDEAVEVLSELVIERVEHPEVAAAEAALEALNGGPVAFGFEDRMRRVDRLAEVRRYADALAELERIERPRARPDLRRYLHQLGMVLYRERHSYAEAAVVLAESARLSGAYAEEDEFHAARALSRADRDPQAIRAYRRFARAHPAHARAPEATYLAAWLEMRHGARAGERQMDRFLRGPMAERAPGLARDATWQLALAAFERGQHRSAEARFERYAAMGTDPLIRARGTYWLGRARQARRDRRGAVAAYREALYVEPLHWYALLARSRLASLGEPVPAPFPDPPEVAPPGAPVVDATLPEEARFYTDLGLDADAVTALTANERALREAGGLEAVVAAYRRLPTPSRLVRLLGGPATTRRPQRPGPADRWRWDAAYPRPWPESAREAATAAGLTPAHLYAVMRQESGFNPDAVSYADARGLMQLLPSTAERVAAPLGLEIRPETLFDPSINIRLGARYVGGLAERFGIPLAFAAFNAGGHRVAQWLDERGGVELDLFVEHIPFEQTRNYVRRVTTHLAHYMYLEDPSRGWPLTLPERAEALVPTSTAE